ncbi:MAG TPA: hypothetical protein VIO61_15040 [Anaerolineaceae bacterium]
MSQNSEPTNKQLSPTSTPISLLGLPSWIVYIGAVIGIIYLINPTAGVLELLPDNLPFIGNLDEGVATVLIWYGVMEYLNWRKIRKSPPINEVPPQKPEQPEIFEGEVVDEGPDQPR